MDTRYGRRKRRALLCALCAAAVTLSSCAGKPERETAEITLPPAQALYAAPVGDAALDYTLDAALHLPRRDGTRLISVTGAVPCSAARLDEESVVRALLAYPGDGVAGPIGGSVSLSLYGTNPVEVSGNVATVNLAASALQLDRKALYLCAQAIANTLTALGNVQYVNVLVMDKQIGLDIASTLPAGALTQSVADDVGAVYEQALSQRVEAGEDPRAQGMTATVTLYFPLSAVNGILSEARNVSFPSQFASDMVLRLLEELSSGPVSVTGSPLLSQLSGLLTEPPSVTDAPNGGGRTVTLRFSQELDTLLSGAGVSRASCMGALCYTFCTFMPNVTGLTAYIGGTRVDHVMLGSTTGLLFDNGVQRRANYAQLLMDECALYLANANGDALVEVSRPIPYYLRTSPRALLLELFKGPTAADGVRGAQAVLPVGLMSDADILGIALTGQTLLVNLSTKFYQAGEGITRERDRLLAYAIVNTLLCGKRTASLNLFVGGETPGNFTGEIYWAGSFYPNPGIAGNR